MSRVLLALLTITAVLLTGYFGVAAWRISEDKDAEISFRAPPWVDRGWTPVSTRR